MKMFIITWTLAVLAGVLPVNTWANSHVFNGTQVDVAVYWIAAGCAGVKPAPSCEKADKNVTTVCKKKVLAPGESSDYHFKDGTSGRRVKAAYCYNNGLNADWNSDNTGNKGNKKHCAVNGSSVQSFNVKCHYSQEEYDALKANSN